MKIALIGYGKMGQMIEKLAQERGHSIVCIIDIHNQDDFNSAAFRSADVAIEFTSPTAAYNNIIRCFDNDIKIVTGSTGWQKEHWHEISEMCKYGLQTLFWSSNFSLGVYLFNKLNVQLAKMMSAYADYKPMLEETHHVHKLDAPSGTALTLAENLVANYPGLTMDNLPIKSIREGEVPGIHSIIYDSQFDEIRITHSAKSRGGFALGAVLAAEYTYEHRGLLTMDDLFNAK